MRSKGFGITAVEADISPTLHGFKEELAHYKLLQSEATNYIFIRNSATLKLNGFCVVSEEMFKFQYSDKVNNDFFVMLATLIKGE